MDHISLDQYLLALREEIPLEVQVRQAHQHLLELCDSCRREWCEGAGGPGNGGPPSPAEDSSRPPSAEPLHVSGQEIEEAERRLSDRREAARLARVDLARLRRLPRTEWRRRVSRSRRRYRSRAFAELLVAESKRHVRSAPREAEALAALVPTVISLHGPSPGERTWTRLLRLRSRAHRANALRIAGDLPAADSVFRTIHEELAIRPHGDIGLVAELASLESSLRSSQRRFGLARALLVRLKEAQQIAGDQLGFAKTLIQLAILERDIGHPSRSLPFLDEAEDYLRGTEDFLLPSCSIIARVNVLCDLDRHDQAEGILVSHGHIIESLDDDYVRAIHQTLRARIDQGYGRFAAAVRGFDSARERCLTLGRDYDACLAALHMADALRALGRFADMRRLALELIPMFAVRGVTREALAAVRLLAC